MAARTKLIDQAPAVAKSRSKSGGRAKDGVQTHDIVATTLTATPPKRRRPEPVLPKPAEPTPELEFMQAMVDYKKSSGRMFPTWSEVLEVLQNLGYRKPDEDRASMSLVSESA